MIREKEIKGGEEQNMGNNKVIVTEEKEHLKKVQMIIKEQIDNVEEQLSASKIDIINQKHFLLWK